ncbi:hypothetical protein XBI1_1940046 [Xenorhabdus bovienii str. Intermedium]|uniref:Uncharacterized protein n=1 Tax=Xenorhabdus bovienii str. Intermedium TaxID=1379677 RepID=A0A077QH39_XENBV|nr:hypothetical protein XBI1_1940046 [Xenorhabdus bovienii str. Intermedium]
MSFKSDTRNGSCIKSVFLALLGFYQVTSEEINAESLSYLILDKS